MANKYNDKYLDNLPYGNYRYGTNNAKRIDYGSLSYNDVVNMYPEYVDMANNMAKDIIGKSAGNTGGYASTYSISAGKNNYQSIFDSLYDAAYGNYYSSNSKSNSNGKSNSNNSENETKFLNWYLRNAYDTLSEEEYDTDSNGSAYNLINDYINRYANKGNIDDSNYSLELYLKDKYGDSYSAGDYNKSQYKSDVKEYNDNRTIDFINNNSRNTRFDRLKDQTYSLLEGNGYGREDIDDMLTNLISSNVEDFAGGANSENYKRLSDFYNSVYNGSGLPGVPQQDEQESNYEYYLPSRPDPIRDINEKMYNYATEQINNSNNMQSDIANNKVVDFNGQKVALNNKTDDNGNIYVDGVGYMNPTELYNALDDDIIAKTNKNSDGSVYITYKSKYYKN